MTTLITGSAGLIGSRLHRRLAEDAEVIGLTHQECDICDYDAVLHSIKLYRPGTVFHLAAHLPSTPDPDFIKVNVTGTSNLLEACYQNGVKNFIYASSMSVYSAPPEYLPVNEAHPAKATDLYGKTKFIGELLCGRYSGMMKTVIVRFSSVFGLGDNSRVACRFMQSAVSGQAIQVDGDGSPSSDFIYVDDATRGVILAMERGKSGEVYNIGSGKETSVLELANLIAELGEPNVEVRLSGKPATRPFRFVADIGKARKELGYCPGDLADGLRRYRKEMIYDGLSGNKGLLGKEQRT
jgi:nucleoside-diphosphate-sugar epimerase